MSRTRKKITPKIRAEVFRDANGICHLCGRKISPGEIWQVEHPKAFGLNGSDDPKDLRPAHDDCHKPKTKKDTAIMRKADRQMKAHFGVKKSRHPMPGSKLSGFRKRMDGTVEKRT